jgi:energy-coupling factor transporter transmembrane protein EcfT
MRILRVIVLALQPIRYAPDALDWWQIMTAILALLGIVGAGGLGVWLWHVLPIWGPLLGLSGLLALLFFWAAYRLQTRLDMFDEALQGALNFEGLNIKATVDEHTNKATVLVGAILKNYSVSPVRYRTVTARAIVGGRTAMGIGTPTVEGSLIPPGGQRIYWCQAVSEVDFSAFPIACEVEYEFQYGYRLAKTEYIHGLSSLVVQLIRQLNDKDAQWVFKEDDKTW